MSLTTATDNPIAGFQEWHRENPLIDVLSLYSVSGLLLHLQTC